MSYNIIPRARLLGRVGGKPVYRFKVVITQEGLDRDLWRHEAEVDVAARAPAEAVNLVRDEIAPKVSHPTEIETRGPKGGLVSRFIGWESMIWAGMCLERDAVQLPLPLAL